MIAETARSASTRGSFGEGLASITGPEFNRHDPWLIEATDKPNAHHAYSGGFPQYLSDLHKG